MSSRIPKPLFMLILCLPLHLFAGNCTEFYQKLGYYNFVRQVTNDGTCDLGVNPDDAWKTLIYRSLAFSDDGMLMVFNSYTKEETPQSTGARVYYFFPRSLMPDIQVQNDLVTVQTATPGLTFKFSRLNSSILDFSWGEFKQDPQIDRANHGGLELKNKKGLMLDSGFAFDQDARGLPNQTSVFTDGAGGTCKVQNTSIYNYLPGDEVQFKFKDDASLSKFLKSTCPQLSVQF
jgi:hypothetical protein